MQHKITKLSLQVVENDVEIPLLQPRLSLNINEAFESRNSSSTCYFVRMRNCDSSSLSALSPQSTCLLVQKFTVHY